MIKNILLTSAFAFVMISATDVAMATTPNNKALRVAGDQYAAAFENEQSGGAQGDLGMAAPASTGKTTKAYGCGFLSEGC